MSRSLSRPQAVVLGLVVLAALGLAGAGVFALGSRQWLWADGFHVRTGFRQVKGVEKGTRVRVQGIDAGEVVGVEPPVTPKGDVVLRLRIRSELRHLVRTDSRVVIASEGMLGGKVVEVRTNPESDKPVVEDDGILESEEAVELADVLREASATLKEVRTGEGKLGTEVLETVKQARNTLVSFQQTMQSAQQVTEAAKRLPWFRNYVKDRGALLVRGNATCHYKVLPAASLFDSSGLALTAKGERLLDEQAAWVAEHLKADGADLVVAAYADPRQPFQDPQLLTDRQSDAVAAYLTAKHAVHKVKRWYLPTALEPTRDVHALGMGVDAPPEPPPVPAAANLPPPRVELLVFVPRK